MRKIAVINQKGGCGKTTTAINLSACLAEQGRRVLLLDLDPQGHSTLGLGTTPEDVRVGMYSVMALETSLEEILHSASPNLDLAPANITLAAIEQKLSGKNQREKRLDQAIAALNHYYDYIIMDCPPSLGLLTINALMATEEVLIPLEAGTFSVHGMDRLLETIEVVEKRRLQALQVHILKTLFENRTRLSKAMSSEISEVFGDRVLKTTIRQTVRLREAVREGRPISEHARSCKGYEDYASLAREIMALEFATPLSTMDEEELLKALEQVQG